ncbi:hypothetical protein Pyn_18318 [Prunus yedoensis var. nudiflora]|uniref:Uncharacterized protein n=1 Tax=Prunus yedoensis var. nudiflora TaxID=2094558 RepID=A0A314XTY2_PRUYE|nr:hypothetical protein Pyn_18318 [Prunus yedoensis var. nudiflora]
MASSIEVEGSWTNVRSGQNLGYESIPAVRSVSEIMALLHPPKENTPPCRDPVEPPLPMIESSLYSIVSDCKDGEYFNCMMSEWVFQLYDE